MRSGSGQTTVPEPVEAMLNSPDRLSVLKGLTIDPAAEAPEFEPLVAVAARLFDAPLALVTLVGAETQWFVARSGTSETRAPSLESFCAHTLVARDGLVVNDAARDPRFSRQRRVVGAPGLSFYAGVPIVLAGQPVGTICVFDLSPRAAVEEVLMQQLRDLARLAASLLEYKDEARRRAIAEQALARDERRHALALEAANVGSWRWDVRSGIVSGNEAMMRMFNLPAGRDIHARDIVEAIHPDDRVKMMERLRAAMKADEEYDGIFRERRKGRWLLGRGRVHERDEKGNPTLFLGINIDVTAEQQTIQRTRLLLRELNHRVKNTLAMLQSLARQTLRQTSDPQEFMTAFAGRLQAISEAHGLLSDHEWDVVRLSPLLMKQVSPYTRDYAKQVEIHKDEILLGPDQAVGLGLVLHELATNAAKYGALSVPDGKIVITARSVREEEGAVLHLTWTEVGGPPVSPPTRRGFGSILIERSLDKVLGSSVQVEYLPAGVTALIRLPL
ncbi:sensor histidine kinase [Ensifer soli]|uniref:sensor histidine kinase n=1 Tax=Ciceribacter sp. sgz301302 TaxID=3342379 RepID=UPI0035B9F8A0